MKTFAATAALLALAQLASAAPRQAATNVAGQLAAAADAAAASSSLPSPSPPPVPAFNGTQTFVMAAVISDPPLDIYASPEDGVYAAETGNPHPGPEQQRFTWDPKTKSVTLDGHPEQSLSVAANGNWLVQGASAATPFMIQRFKQGLGHDNDLELHPYKADGVTPYNAILGCPTPDSTHLNLRARHDLPKDCYGGYFDLGVLVTVVSGASAS